MSGNHLDNFRAAVFADVGGAPDNIEPGRMHRFSTTGKRSNRSGWCQFFTDGRAGIYGDFRVGVSSVWSAVDRNRMTPAERFDLVQVIAQAKAKRDADTLRARTAAADRNARTWSQSAPVRADGTGRDPVTLYLKRRLVLAADEPLAVPAVLRLHSALPYFDEDGANVGTWPAMVAAMQNPAGELVALHRTWLTIDGRKAPVPGAVKKVSAASGPLAGACIQLDWPDGEVPAMGVSEGIETALAARCASGLPTVAAYSASALSAWQWPPRLRRVVIFADADPAGAQAADKLRQRARAAGLSVHVMTPSTPGFDWCDVWAQRGIAGAVEVQA